MLNGLFVLTYLIFPTALRSMYYKYSHFKYRKQSLENTTCSRLLLRVICMCSITQLCLWPHGLQSARLLCPWDFPGKHARVGCHFLLQGIFSIQGLNPGVLHFLHWHVASLSPCHLGSPLRIRSVIQIPDHLAR